MSLGLVIGAGLLGTSLVGFVAKHFLLKPNSKIGNLITTRAQNEQEELDAIIRRHAKDDFSDEDTIPRRKIPYFAFVQSLLLGSSIACHYSAVGDKLPKNLKPFASVDGVLHDDDCKRLIRACDYDRNRTLSLSEFKRLQSYYDELSNWGVNNSLSKRNLRDAVERVQYFDGEISR